MLDSVGTWNCPLITKRYSLHILCSVHLPNCGLRRRARSADRHRCQHEGNLHLPSVVGHRSFSPSLIAKLRRNWCPNAPAPSVLYTDFMSCRESADLSPISHSLIAYCAKSASLPLSVALQWHIIGCKLFQLYSSNGVIKWLCRSEMHFTRML